MGPQQPPLMIGQVLTIYGPVLPPVMQWQRSFEKMLPFIWSSNIPQFVFKSDIGAILNKHSCEALCSGPVSTLKLLPAPDSSISFAPDVPTATVKRPVARALCFDDLDDPVSETFEFSAVLEVTLKRARKSQASRIIVDTEVRRSARLSALRDGYRKVTSGISPKKSHTLKKRKASNSQSENSSSVPPPTAIADLQRIGARLRIAPEKISTDKLVADPAKSSSSRGSDD